MLKNIFGPLLIIAVAARRRALPSPPDVDRSQQDSLVYRSLYLQFLSLCSWPPLPVY